MAWITSWPAWMVLLSVAVTVGLPRVPYYQEGLPYIYDLGGLALVAWFIGFGFLILGLYFVVMGCVSAGWFLSRRLSAVLFGGVALIFAGGCYWFYLILLEMSVKVT
ncbi:hypothetical protein ACTRXD_21865 [Nitrospira sp. T9]|uniref:hypothetical protein n=1 Tax=unclassified Nitrospira TaxID=2652172 RepID=UPI003F972FD1